MELPFAVTETKTSTTTTTPSGYSTNLHPVGVSSIISSSSSLSSSTTTTTTAYSHPNPPSVSKTASMNNFQQSSTMAMTNIPSNPLSAAVLPSSTRNMYDNVRLSYFGPSSSSSSSTVSSHSHSPHYTFHSSQKMPRNHDQVSKTNNPLDDTVEDHHHHHDDDGHEENIEDEDFYIAVDEDSFISLSTYHHQKQQQYDLSNNTNLGSAEKHKHSVTPPSSSSSSPTKETHYDVLTLLLDSSSSTSQNTLVQLCDEASIEATRAYDTIRLGDVSSSVLHHLQASRLFREAAIRVKHPLHTSTTTNSNQQQQHPDDVYPHMSYSSSTSRTYPFTLVYNLLLLCQIHAQHAESLLKSGALLLDNDTIQEYWNFISNYNNNKKKKQKTQNKTQQSQEEENTTNIATSDLLVSSPSSSPSSIGYNHEQITSNTNTTSSTKNNNSSSNSHSNRSSSTPPSLSLPPEDRLRATIRASMTRNNEVDMTESTFLGGMKEKSNGETLGTSITTTHSSIPSPTTINTSSIHIQATARHHLNPIDDMMRLEKELRDMDMTIDLGVGVGNSALSLTDLSSHVIHHHPLPSTSSYKDMDINDCSVLPSSSLALGASYMSSSSMWASHSIHKTTSSHTTTSTTAAPFINQHTIISNPILGGRGRGDRVKSTYTKSTSHSSNSNLNIPPKSNSSLSTSISSPHTHANLENSWWGHASILASSTVSLGNSIVGIKSPSYYQGSGASIHSSSVIHPHHSSIPSSSASSSSPPVTTKQLLRLLDTIRTLGDENASLLREVENAQKAQLEAKATREAMKHFQDEYSKRFSTLKLALEQYKRENPTSMTTSSSSHCTTPPSSHPIQTSTYVASEAALRNKDMEIEKLQAQLKQEREESKKKENALRKYENFYKEVKARSAQKAKQREDEQKNKP